MRGSGRVAAGALATIAVVVGSGAQLSPAAPASRPSFDKACGSVEVGGESFAVDVVETRGRAPKGCGVARAVMTKFLRRSPGPYEGPNNETVPYRGRKFGCYVSRGDEGWAYICGWHSSSTSAYGYYGAGRIGF